MGKLTSDRQSKRAAPHMLVDKNIKAQRVLLCAATMLAALLAGQACAAQDGSALRSLDAKQLYQKLCSVCHGDKVDGDSRAAGSFNPRPRNFTAAESATELSRERMIR